MPSKSKSIFRQPTAQHFQLVHRSQRDPLIHDPEASQHVLKPFVRENEKKACFAFGKTRAELEALLAIPDGGTGGQRSNIGEAALYGVYFDDTEYDYMQHLRQVEVQEDDVDSVWVEAPAPSKSKGGKGKGKDAASLELRDETKQARDLPKEVFASSSELLRTYESQQAVPDSIAGFQPDMDPHLRQVLEALEDDAFVDDDLEDGFFGELVADGERGTDEVVEFEFQEEDVSEGKGAAEASPGGAEEDELDGVDLPWEQRFDRFQKAQKAANARGPGSDDEPNSEAGDTINGLPSLSVLGGRRRRWKGTSDASGYSMSSSALYRTEALQTLDEQFDQMMLKEYNEDEEDDEDPPDSDSENDAPELITSRDDFATMMNEFLDDYEILGRRLKPKLGGETGVEKLDTFRRAFGEVRQVDLDRVDDNDVDDDDLFSDDDEDKYDRWDCETILCMSTYSNLENHPKIISARSLSDKRHKGSVPQISLDPKTGIPIVASEDTRTERRRVEERRARHRDSDASGTETETEHNQRRATVTRPRGESKEDKKARKAVMKAERQSRRANKKATKEQFSVERTRAGGAGVGAMAERLRKL
ncbi:LTV-domain-containing protein [Fistulina hepatica ATCC 64428]|uniref:LTV-domain-containing protein n=1 Tax=Fistulina hepatica ATCC 64428 TaxID=1128425 RepID=A0A0D7A6K3_9AGAR|nr:LTV-domain-containing protein [Fistulina hepatica ATCC 64428]